MASEAEVVGEQIYLVRQEGLNWVKSLGTIDGNGDLVIPAANLATINNRTDTTWENAGGSQAYYVGKGDLVNTALKEHGAHPPYGIHISLMGMVPAE